MRFINLLLLVSGTASVAQNDLEDMGCSRFSSVHFKTTLNQDAIQRFSEWKEKNSADLNTCESRKLQFERLQQEHCTGQRDFNKVGYDLAWNVLTLSVSFGVPYACYLGCSWYQQPKRPLKRTTPAPAATAFSVAAIVGGMLPGFQSFAAQVVGSVRTSIMDQNEGLKYVHNILKEKSADMVGNLPDDVRQKVESFDRGIMTSLANKDTDKAFKLLRRREQVYLTIPTKILNVSHRDHNGDKKIKKILDHRVRDLIGRYPKNQQAALEILVSTIRDNSVASHGNRVQAYLYGPPGTGKTTFVNQLGEALGLPVCLVSLASMEPGQLLGPLWPDEFFQKSEEELLGKVASCYAKSGYKNPIIFFDEAGEYLSDSATKSPGFDMDQNKRQLIQAEFKKLTDPSSASIDHIGLGIKIDMSRTTFLFASNYPLTNTALLSRIPQISLSKLTRTEKERAAMSSLERFLCEKSEFISESEIEPIRALVVQYLPYIVDEDEKRNPGARTIQTVIGEFVSRVEALQEKERISGESQITDELLKAEILGSFERREPLSNAHRPTPVPAPDPLTLTPEQVSCDV